MKLTDLVVLQYSSNPCCVEVVRPNKVEGLKVNTKSGTYTFKGSKILKVGKPVYMGKLLGVFDRTRIEHLDNMVYYATGVTNNYYHSRYDD